MSKWAVALALGPTGCFGWLVVYAQNTGAQRHHALIIGHSVLVIGYSKNDCTKCP